MACLVTLPRFFGAQPVNVLIVGSGAREHALAWKLRESPRLTDLFVAPGNGQHVWQCLHHTCGAAFAFQ